MATSLHEIALEGVVVQLSEFLAEHGRLGIDEEDESGQTALIIAAQHGHVHCVKFLLAQGADPTAVDNDGRSALHWACAQGYHKIVQALIKKEPDMVAAKDVLGCVPLHLAAQAPSSKVMKALFPASRPYIDLPDGSGLTPAHWCTSQGRYKHLAYLIEMDVNLQARDQQGRTVLHWTAMNENDRCCKQIMVFAPGVINEQDNNGCTALMLAIQENNELTVKAQLASKACQLSLKDNERRNCLHWAAIVGNSALLRFLVDQGAPVNEPDINGLFPVHMALKEDTSCLEMLLQHGADVNAIDEEERSPLLLAAAQGLDICVERLLAAKAKPNLINTDGHTALHMAAHEGHTSVCRLLIQAGAAVDIKDKEGNAPLLYACTNSQSEACDVLLKAGASAATVDMEGRTLVHWAAITGSSETMAMLQKYDTDSNAHDQLGRTPLHYAAFHGQVITASELLEGGANIDATDNEGVTALHWACSAGHTDMIQLLLQEGANVNAMEFELNRTPLDYVFASEDPGVREALSAFLRMQGALTIGELKPRAATRIQAWWKRARARVALRKHQQQQTSQAAKDSSAKGDFKNSTVESAGEGLVGTSKRKGATETEVREGDSSIKAAPAAVASSKSNHDDRGKGEAKGMNEGRARKVPYQQHAGSRKDGENRVQEAREQKDEEGTAAGKTPTGAKSDQGTEPERSSTPTATESRRTTAPLKTKEEMLEPGCDSSSGSPTSQTQTRSRPLSASAQRHVEEQGRRRLREQQQQEALAADPADAPTPSARDELLKRISGMAEQRKAEHKRRAKIRCLTNAAIVIQRSIRRFLQRQREEREMSVLLSTADVVSSSTPGAKQGDRTKPFSTPQRRVLQRTSVVSSIRAPISASEPPRPPSNAQREVAALTLQLWWRRHLRRKYARDMESRITLKPWTPQVLGAHQGLRVQQTYGCRASKVPDCTPEWPPVPVRPPYMARLPSSAERSFSFAVSAYCPPAIVDNAITRARSDSAATHHTPA